MALLAHNAMAQATAQLATAQARSVVLVAPAVLAQVSANLVTAQARFRAHRLKRKRRLPCAIAEAAALPRIHYIKEDFMKKRRALKLGGVMALFANPLCLNGCGRFAGISFRERGIYVLQLLRGFH